MNKAAKLVADAILGLDFITIVLGGKAYTVRPPVIKTIAGAAGYLSAMGGEQTFADVVDSLQSVNDAAKALSWFISGDESLSEELSSCCTLEEVSEALKRCFSLISGEDFTKLSVLAKNVAELAAKPR